MQKRKPETTRKQMRKVLVYSATEQPENVPPRDLTLPTKRTHGFFFYLFVPVPIYVLAFAGGIIGSAWIYKNFFSGSIKKLPDCMIDWSPWSSCNAPCGSGLKFRDSLIRNAKTSCLMKAESAFPKESASCFIKDCQEPRICETQWNAWVPCSITCGVGVTTRYRTLKPMEKGCLYDTDPGNSQTKSCTMNPCAQTCLLQWTGWSPCITVLGCGDGIKKRSLAVTSVGCIFQPSVPSSKRTQTALCRLSTCPVDSICYNNPCLNGATCVGESIYSCLCSNGFTGVLCENKINTCDSYPCRNNGTCTGTYLNYTCACITGKAGSNCEQDMMPACPYYWSPWSSCTNDKGCGDGNYNRTLTINQTANCLPDGSVMVNAIQSGYCRLQDCIVNNCQSNPCLNGGTCTSSQSQYSCSCPIGFDGLRCVNHINMCDSFPCRNNGTCTGNYSNYTCACVKGTSDKNCELVISCPYVWSTWSSCTNDKGCGDGSYNRTLAINQTANCLPDESVMANTVQSAYCKLQDCLVDYCLSNPCLNGAKCVTSGLNYSCTCAPGFTGLRCDIQISTCDSLPCWNNGTCFGNHINYTCACVTGQSGINCEQVISCPYVWSHWSSCTNDIGCGDGSYKRTLTINQTANCVPDGPVIVNNTQSAYCKLPDCIVIICKSDSCFNGGTCVHTGSNFTCTCTAAFTGLRCELDVNQCDSSPCLNGGTCIGDYLGYTCICNQNFYYGTHCENGKCHFLIADRGGGMLLVDLYNRRFSVVYSNVYGVFNLVTTTTDMFWTACQSSKITDPRDGLYHGKVDGSITPERIVSFKGCNSVGIAIDPIAQLLLVDVYLNGIQQMNYNGSGKVYVYYAGKSFGQSYGIQVNPNTKEVFWTSTSGINGCVYGLQVSNANVALIYRVYNALFLAIDLPTTTLYYTIKGDNYLYSVRTDGRNFLKMVDLGRYSQQLTTCNGYIHLAGATVPSQIVIQSVSHQTRSLSSISTPASDQPCIYYQGISNLPSNDTL